MSGPRCHERGKIAFSSFDQAEKEANKLTWRNRKRGNPAKVGVYICPECAMLHIGRGPRGHDADRSLKKP